MFRSMIIAAAVVLAVPAAPLAHDTEYDFDEEWGYVDDLGPDASYEAEIGDDGAVTHETFEEGLAPHGEWVTVTTYGRVWRPRHVQSGWRPYYYGNWEWTDEGWLWVSSEPWGWATYHYGRWAYDPFYGWFWVPGYQWAPAWVTWRYGVDYIGWAPLYPGVSVYVTSYPVVHDHWVFAPCNRFVGVPVHTVAVVGPRVGRIWSGTQPAPPRATVQGARAPAWGGPARQFVERRVGRAVTPVRVQPVATPSALSAPRRAGVVPVYRPEVARVSPGGRRSVAAPRSGAATAPAPNAGAVPRQRGPASTESRQEAPSRAQPAPRRAPAAPPAAPGDRANGERSRDRSVVRQHESPGGAAPPVYRPAPRGDGGGAPSRVAPPRSGGGGAAAPRGGGNGGGKRAAPSRD